MSYMKQKKKEKKKVWTLKSAHYRLEILGWDHYRFFEIQVLCFDAYFQEAVHEKREEQYRIRRYAISSPWLEQMRRLESNI